MWNKNLRVKLALISAISIIAVSVFLTASMFIYAGKALKPTADTIDTLLISPLPREDVFVFDKGEFFLAGIASMAVAALVGIVCSWHFTRRALKPLSQLSSRLENTDVNNLPQSIPLPAGRDEVYRLAQSFNTMLAKVSAAIEGQKRFVQNAAHELKTPVTAIIANIEVLELDEDPGIEDYKQVVGATRENAARMHTLVDDLLMVNIQSREENSWFSFSEITDFLDQLSRDIAEKKLEVTVEGDVDICGNKALLRRAFHNLVLNAVRYNKEGGRIEIRCREKEITISDTGIGIPADKADKIFEPFYCVDPSRSRKLGGSGLGLAIVKQIFHQHKIRVEVKSREKQGTTFTIKLPS